MVICILSRLLAGKTTIRGPKPGRGKARGSFLFQNAQGKLRPIYFSISRVRGPLFRAVKRPIRAAEH